MAGNTRHSAFNLCRQTPYLGSGTVRGIGPVHAKNLTARFCKELFEVIEKIPNSLEQVDGIDSKPKPNDYEVME